MIRSGILTTVVGLAAAGAGWAQLGPPKIIILVGPPGSGKTTQAQVLAKKYGIPTFSMSDLLKRQMARKKDAVSKALAAGIASGDIMPDDAANDLIRVQLMRADLSKGFVLDGYPATAGQAKQMDALLQEQQLPKPVVVVFDAPDEVIRSRMMKRKRADDKPEIIDARIRGFRDQASLLADWWGRENFVRVDATGSIATVSAKVLTGVEDAMSKRTFAQRR